MFGLIKQILIEFFLWLDGQFNKQNVAAISTSSAWHVVNVFSLGSEAVAQR